MVRNKMVVYKYFLSNGKVYGPILDQINFPPKNSVSFVIMIAIVDQMLRIF